MAAFCPKCGYKLSMIDIKPECPVCGVNQVYYGMEESLKQEADRAEFEHAAGQPRMDRLKAATIGHPVAIIRLVFSLLPLLATLVPMGTVAVSLPFYENTLTVNLVSIITEVFMKLNLDHIFAMMDSAKVGTAYLCYVLAIVFLVFALLACIVNIVNLIFSCGKKGFVRNVTTAAIGIVFAVAATICFNTWISGMNAAVPEVFTGTINVLGPICIILAFVLQIVINVVYKKMNIQVKYKDMSMYLLSYDERKKLEEEKAEKEEKAEAEVEA